MHDLITSYYDSLRKSIMDMAVTDDAGRSLTLRRGFEKAVQLVMKCKKSGNILMFIGNGASAAISSHMAADFLKNGNIRAMAFNDGALLTCVANDLGYKHVFQKPIETLSNKGDILIAISSSGKSENILCGTKSAKTLGMKIITLTGFSGNNPLRKLGDVNFYVPSFSYGHVEVLHHSVCHCILDVIIHDRLNVAGKRRVRYA